MSDVIQHSNGTTTREGHRPGDAGEGRAYAENTYIETPQEYGKVCSASNRSQKVTRAYIDS